MTLIAPSRDLWVPKRPGLIKALAFDEEIYERSRQTRLAYGGPPQGKMSSGRMDSDRLGGPIGKQAFTFVGYCTSTGATLDFGSLSSGAIAAGDLAIYFDFPRHSSTPTAVTPTGFTNRVNSALSASRGMISDKKLDGTEGAITGMDGSNSDRKTGLVFRSTVPFTTITTSTPTTEITTGNPASQAISPSGETVAVIVIGVSGAPFATADFTTASPAFDEEIVSGDAFMLTGYKIYAAGAAANHTIDMGDVGTHNWLAGLYYKVS